MNKNFLLKYLNSDSPSTYEVESQQIWVDYASTLTPKVHTDNYGNAYAIIESIESDYKVVIDAHCDEIGWVISSIEDNGFIRVKRNGGTDNYITPGANVRILTDNGTKIKGVFGTVPIHFKNKNEELIPTEENIYIDVLASSKDDVEKMGIEIGNYVVYDRISELVNNKYVIGKGLDDKIGGFIIAEVLKRLKEDNITLPYNLYVVNSVQEELGLRGSKMITETIKPDVAICFDVHFDTSTPNIDKTKFGDTKLNDGLVFRTGHDTHPKLLKLMKDVAKNNYVKYKQIVGGAGGTNTTSYNLSNGGVVTGSLSIPLRYMHSPNEIVSLDDVELSISYFIELLKSISDNHNFKLV